MAKTALKKKQAREPKFGVRAYTRCNRCGRPVPRLHSRTGSARRASGCHQVQLVNATSQVRKGNRDEEGQAPNVND